MNADDADTLQRGLKRIFIREHLRCLHPFYQRSIEQKAMGTLMTLILYNAD